MSFNVVREHKVHMKISEFTVNNQILQFYIKFPKNL